MTLSVSSKTQVAVQCSAEEIALQDVWLKILKALYPRISRSLFITWFRDTAILGKDDGTFIIGLPIPMGLEWHLEHYRGITLEEVQKIDPTIKKLVYKVDGALKDNRSRTFDLLEHFPEQKKGRKLPNKQEIKLPEGIISRILNPRYMLDNFVVGSGNRLAHAACQAVAAYPGGKYNPLYLYGEVGLGKTHLLQATGNAILRQMPKAAVVYTTSEDFTNEVVDAIRTQKMEKFRSRYRKVDVLIIDDIQFLTNKDRTQEEFFHTFNSLYEANKQIILSGDRPPKELLLEDRLKSRCERGMIADIDAPDYETRLAILTEKALEYELFIDPKVLQFIAEHATRNVRELEGILMQAVAQFELEERMPSVKSISEIMSKFHGAVVDKKEENIGFDMPKNRAPTFQHIMEAVSTYYSVSLQDITGKSRVREILIPRQISMYLGKKHARMSFVGIGEVCSGRDHTTVMHAVHKIETQLNDDPQLLRQVRAIERDMGIIV
ncbi:chromosomal replication initiator protein DnaA [Candidatus Peregrinibacteria bacterium]|nr:chromosomal replication initiator protein DnaA [Candidatus Peregrinibacteria bacterium]MBT3599174.1 chromosomal replication initiator protein DnaA [Candidatus Peregrinibacteria bacterium]MBT6730681.1 chromosomal replication initiator protein DnaA [Candidatus Peregrinibacteria bacterium]MBT7009140.1 chromosomal replication initiator protein DnaA [Candidatus Peregrinibacteria bacterium]MBT7344403.1 chromosomal replication initiator protein DnaA [Candidatus Peregrinibacteria bacterium]